MRNRPEWFDFLLYIIFGLGSEHGIIDRIPMWLFWLLTIVGCLIFVALVGVAIIVVEALLLWLATMAGLV